MRLAKAHAAAVVKDRRRRREAGRVGPRVLPVGSPRGSRYRRGEAGRAGLGVEAGDRLWTADAGDDGFAARLASGSAARSSSRARSSLSEQGSIGVPGRGSSRASSAGRRWGGVRPPTGNAGTPRDRRAPCPVRPQMRRVAVAVCAACLSSLRSTSTKSGEAWAMSSSALCSVSNTPNSQTTKMGHVWAFSANSG